jgi:REP element-mobilizing transposase RayT
MDHQRRRKSMRLQGFDYRTPSLYHVVNCTRYGIHRFGAVEEGIMQPNEIGEMILNIWDEIPAQFPTVSLDASVLMPNHHHGIIWIEDRPDEESGPALGDIMRWFKTVTTIRYSHGVHMLGWEPYERRFWHRNYYDHIIRDDRDLNRIRLYIEHNPATWKTDDFYLMPGSTWS